MNEIATTAQLRYNVKGKVLMIGKLGHIPFNNESIPKFAYVLGSPRGTMEVAVLGKTAFGKEMQLHHCSTMSLAFSEQDGTTSVEL